MFRPLVLFFQLFKRGTLAGRVTFGAMLAGGCAVGAGLSGGAIMALTAWVAVFCMWLGAMATQALLNRGAAPHPVAG